MDVAEAFAKAVRWVMRDTTYHAQYVGTVERQHTDGTLDLTPDDERVRGNGLSNVPIRHGLPGVDVRVVVGSRVLLGFENGDPRQPYASCWERGNIESITFDNGVQRLARQGDLVQSGGPGCVLTLTPMPGNVAPSVLPATPYLVSFSALPSDVGPFAKPLYGAISTGAPKVKA